MSSVVAIPLPRPRPRPAPGSVQSVAAVTELPVVAAVAAREVMMGEDNGVASVIMLTFTKRPVPHAAFYKEARPSC